MPASWVWVGGLYCAAVLIGLAIAFRWVVRLLRERPAMLGNMQAAMVLCGHYKPDGCLCPARRLRWWSVRRWIIGPRPPCVFDEARMKAAWTSEPDRKLWQPQPVTCDYIIPPGEQAK